MFKGLTRGQGVDELKNVRQIVEDKSRRRRKGSVDLFRNGAVPMVVKK